MIPARASRGVVSLAALDLRGRPDHRSELTSQLLLGEVVRVLATANAGRWVRIENATDGYRGWARSWGLVPCSPRRASAWAKRARGRVVRLYAEVRTAPGAGALVSPVFWNGRLILGSARDGHRLAELPDGRRGWIESGAVSQASRGGPRLMERVRGLLGIPYLWGGRTPLGIDCSALVQQVLGEQGIRLPRDAHQQFRVTKDLDGQRARVGDLMFFGNPRVRPGHVGLALGGGYFLHARGRVRINSIDPDNILCDNELRQQLRAVKRPVRGPLRPLTGRARSRIPLDGQDRVS